MCLYVWRYDVFGRKKDRPSWRQALIRKRRQMTVLSSQSPGISPSYPETLNSAPGLSSVPGLPHMLGGEWNSAQTETQSGPGNLSRFKQYGERSGMERGEQRPLVLSMPHSIVSACSSQPEWLRSQYPKENLWADHPNIHPLTIVIAPLESFLGGLESFLLHNPLLRFKSINTN